jgi:hypothetical protein
MAEFLSSKTPAIWFLSDGRMQIKQPPRTLSPSNENLKGKSFAQKFVKSGQKSILRNAGWSAV